jgi:hypothetical protein
VTSTVRRFPAFGCGRLALGPDPFGAATVAAFSLGLAITMVSMGVAAAWGVQHAAKRINLSDRLLRRLPWLRPASSVFLALLCWCRASSTVQRPQQPCRRVRGEGANIPKSCTFRMPAAAKGGSSAALSILSTVQA